MNLLQAIEQAGGNWFRPKGDKDYALSFHKRGWMMIHKYRKAYSEFESSEYNLSLIEEFTGEWEIVTPEQVIAERAK